MWLDSLPTRVALKNLPLEQLRVVLWRDWLLVGSIGRDWIPRSLQEGIHRDRIGRRRRHLGEGVLDVESSLPLCGPIEDLDRLGRLFDRLVFLGHEAP